MMQTLKKCLLSAVLFAGLFLPLHAAGLQSNDDRMHDGFFMRFLLGFGPGNLAFDLSGSEMKFSSTGTLFHFQIGKEIMPNLALFGDLGGFSLTDPEVSWQGSTITVQDVSISSVGFGAGLTYYFMPLNAYVSGSVLIAQASFDFDGNEGESERGPGFMFAIGKEWWVGQKWTLGVSAFVEGARLKDQPDAGGHKAPISTQIVGLAFSATMY
jgi:hypothetical protein